jgi:hypothetical protein
MEGKFLSGLRGTLFPGAGRGPGSQALQTRLRGWTLDPGLRWGTGLASEHMDRARPEMPNARVVSDPGTRVTNDRQPP